MHFHRNPDLGRRTSLTRGNGTVTSYGYDPVSRLASLAHDLGGTAHDLSLTFAHKPASQIVTNTRSNDAYAWTGHGSGSTGSTVNGLNQLTQVGATAITHDARGNVTSDGVRSFAYTAENLLAKVDGADRFALDALGRIYHGRLWPMSLGYDGPLLSEEYGYVAGYPFLRRYVFGPGRQSRPT